jgi:hypothetical protein
VTEKVITIEKHVFVTGFYGQYTMIFLNKVACYTDAA